MQDANYGLWIIGIISAAALAASAILAFMEFFVSVTGNAGRHTAGLSFPMGYASPLGNSENSLHIETDLRDLRYHGLLC